MNNLEERLQDRKEDYERMCVVERLIEPTIERLKELFPNGRLTGSAHSTWTYLYLYTEIGVEETEETVVNKLSEELEITWERYIEKESLKFAGTVIIGEGYSIDLEVIPKIEGTCRIIANPTGKMKSEGKYVYVDVPEVEYLLDCGEEEKDE